VVEVDYRDNNNNNMYALQVKSPPPKRRNTEKKNASPDNRIIRSPRKKGSPGIDQTYDEECNSKRNKLHDNSSTSSPDSVLFNQDLDLVVSQFQKGIVLRDAPPIDEVDDLSVSSARKIVLTTAAATNLFATMSTDSSFISETTCEGDDDGIEHDTNDVNNDNKLALPTMSIPQLVNALWNDNLCVVTQALISLADLCDCDAPDGFMEEAAKKNRKELRQMGGLLAVVNFMKKHRSKAVVQFEGCRLLWSYVGGGDDPYDTAIAKAGGIETILQAMEHHPTFGDLQEIGCRTLHYFTCGSAVNAKSVAEHNGLTIIVQAMKEYPQNEELQEHALWALSSLARDDQERLGNGSAIFRAGGLSAIAVAAEQYAQHSDSIKEALADVLETLSESIRD